MFFADLYSSYSYFNILELQNLSNEGTVFTTNIYVTQLFNRNRLNFTLQSEGTFVDDDLDGLLDNLDHYPVGGTDFDSDKLTASPIPQEIKDRLLSSECKYYQ